MRGNLVDWGILAVIALGVWRGRKRGLARELPRVAGWMVIVFTGLGMLRWTGRGLSPAAEGMGLSLGLFGFALATAAGFWVTLRIRSDVRQWAERKFPHPHHQRVGGMIAGGSRAFLISAYALFLIGMLPIGVFKKPFTSGSLVGSVLHQTVRPIRDAARD